MALEDEAAKRRRKRRRARIGDVIEVRLVSGRIAYLHYTYLWPLKTEKLEDLAKRSKRIVLIEQNYRGQLGSLIRMESGLEISRRILKYDGRPFFYDEILSLLQLQLADDLEGSDLASTSNGEHRSGQPELAHARL